MKFPGFWVSKNETNIIVSRADFDDTELSEASDWTEASENVDSSYSHGFIDPLAMLHGVCGQLVGELTEGNSFEAHERITSDEGYVVRGIEDFARLIQIYVPAKVAIPVSKTGSATYVQSTHEVADIPFD
jgi:hypothetical protein